MSRNIALAGIALSLLSCSEYNYTSKVQKDVFQQVRRNTVDILLVIDNSCSMGEEQEKLALNFDNFISAFAGVDVDWQMGVTTTDTYRAENPGELLGGEDEIILEDPDGRQIDRVQWNSDWPVTPGASIQLSADAFTTNANAIMSNWCVSAEIYGDGDMGSPGQDNELCAPQLPLPEDDTGEAGEPSDEEEDTDTAPSTPSVGDVLITEIMMDPVQSQDAHGEWVELTNLTSEPLDLSGYRISDEGRNLVTLPDGAIISPNGHYVIGRSDDASLNGGVPLDVAFAEGMTLNNNMKVLTSQTEGAQEIFSELVVVGTSGSGIEMGLEAAKLALSEPLMSNENAGLVREDANLSLIFVSDEDDFSPMSAHDYLKFFTDIKGPAAYRDHSRLRVSAVVGKDTPPYEGAPSCQSADGSGDYGPRYIELATRTEGSLESICDEDFSYIAQELGLTASGLILEFELSAPADNTTLVVKTYAEEREDSLIAELVRDQDYTYVLEKNSIRFEIDKLPPSETFIVVEYRVLPKGAVLVEEDSAEEEGE